MFVLVGKLVLKHGVTHAAVLACGCIGAIGIVDIVLHRLRVLTLKTGGRRNRIDDVASLFVHDDAARPYRQFRVAHDRPSLLL